jgi:hypothetical protein
MFLIISILLDDNSIQIHDMCQYFSQVNDKLNNVAIEFIRHEEGDRRALNPFKNNIADQDIVENGYFLRNSKVAPHQIEVYYKKIIVEPGVLWGKNVKHNCQKIMFFTVSQVDSKILNPALNLNNNNTSNNTNDVNTNNNSSSNYNRIELPNKRNNGREKEHGTHVLMIEELKKRLSNRTIRNSTDVTLLNMIEGKLHSEKETKLKQNTLNKPESIMNSIIKALPHPPRYNSDTENTDNDCSDSDNTDDKLLEDVEIIENLNISINNLNDF